MKFSAYFPPHPATQKFSRRPANHVEVFRRPPSHMKLSAVPPSRMMFTAPPGHSKFSRRPRVLTPPLELTGMMVTARVADSGLSNTIP